MAAIWDGRSLRGRVGWGPCASTEAPASVTEPAVVATCAAAPTESATSASCEVPHGASVQWTGGPQPDSPVPLAYKGRGNIPAKFES
eukprot:3919100-Lingulodinium_polyedra.AAC.1